MSGRPAAGDVDELHRRLESEATRGGYHLNPDREFTRDLVEALLTNIQRYGYASCPCRLAAGTRAEDLDIICPCYYRDPDLAEYDACYCALYVSGKVADGEKEAGPIPERRKKGSDAKTRGHGDAGSSKGSGRGGGAAREPAYPVWRCGVCGYLCAKEHPPEKCPICKADRDRFERFL